MLTDADRKKFEEIGKWNEEQVIIAVTHLKDSDGWNLLRAHFHDQIQFMDNAAGSAMSGDHCLKFSAVAKVFREVDGLPDQIVKNIREEQEKRRLENEAEEQAKGVQTAARALKLARINGGE